MNISQFKRVVSNYLSGNARVAFTPVGLGIDRNGVIYISAQYAGVHKVDAADNTSQLAPGYQRAPGTMLVDNSGALFFGGDLDNPFTSNIAGGVRTLYAGNPYRFMDGTLTTAQFSSITGMPRNAVTGEMYVADDHAIRLITDSRVSGSLAGRGSSPVSGYDNGTLYNAINGICVDKKEIFI